MAQPQESTVAVMIDCDNVAPEIVDFALLMAAQAGRVTLRRGYGNRTTLGNYWQEALVRQAFTPCLQFQYGAKKNTADIALALDALEALFDLLGALSASPVIRMARSQVPPTISMRSSCTM